MEHPSVSYDLPERLRVEVADERLSAEFFRRLARYFGFYKYIPAQYQPMLPIWFRDHAGGRTQWFSEDLVWRLETARPLAGLRVLDFGCGTGSSAVVFAERGAEVTGIDTEQVSLDIAVQRAEDWGLSARCSFQLIQYLSATCRRLPFEPQSFDVVTLIGVLEHMLPAEHVLCAAEIERLLRPDGQVFIFDTPNRAHPFDYHTTRLWLAHWLPERLARRYAVLKKRLAPGDDYCRRGGRGVTRWQIERLFPKDRWSVYYEKSRAQVEIELAWLVDQMAFVPGDEGRRERWTQRLRSWAEGFLDFAEWCGGRPVFWTSSHTIGLRRSEPVLR